MRGGCAANNRESSGSTTNLQAVGLAHFFRTVGCFPREYQSGRQWPAVSRFAPRSTQPVQTFPAPSRRDIARGTERNRRDFSTRRFSAAFSPQRLRQSWLRPRSSQYRPRCVQRWFFHQEMFVGHVQRLVTLCRRIPGDPNGQDMVIGSALDRSEVQLNSFDGVLVPLNLPASDGTQRRQREIALGIFQIFIAAQKLRPFSVGFFGEYGARHDGSRNIIFWRFGDDIRGKKLLLAGFCEVSKHENLRLFS